MKKLAFLLGVSLLILLMGQAKGYTQDWYYYQTSSSGDWSLKALTRLVPVNGSCISNLRLYADMNTGSSWNYNFYLYENETLLFYYPSGARFGAETCLPLGNWNVSKGDINVTARALSIGSPVSVTLYLEIHTNCTANNNFIVFNGTESYNYTTRTKGYNIYQEQTVKTQGGGFPIYYSQMPLPNATWNNLEPDRCIKHNKTTAKVDYVRLRYWFPENYYEKRDIQYFVPFNSGSGNVTIEYLLNGNSTGATVVAHYGYIRPDNTVIELGYNSTQMSVKYDLTLEYDEEYVAWIETETTSGDAFYVPPPWFNISVSAYEPNLVCEPWSTCENYQQTRLCNDTNGIVPPFFQTRNCIAVNQTAVLGFENYYIPAQRQICQPIWFPLCGMSGYEGFGALANVTVLFPDNPRWSIVPDNPLYYITTITSETATLGSRSLKLWYIPQSPYNDQPTNVNGTILCQNTTYGTYPEIYREVNTTFMASYDFTFPSSTMKLMFDVKRCDNNVVQYDNWCGLRCYAQNCSIQPSGDFFARLYDQAEQRNVFELTKEASLNWTTYIVPLGSNIVEDRNYTLSFSVLPLPINPTTGEGNCVYFDNVRLINEQTSVYDDWAEQYYNTTWEDLTDEEKQAILLVECVNECIGNDYHVRTIQGLTCIETIQLNESSCVTQYQQQQIGNQSIFLPISSIANTIVNTTTNETLSHSIQAGGYGFVLVFLTPIFWIFMVIIAVMIVASYYTKHMEIGGVAGMLLLVAFAAYFPELIWITIVIIIIGAYLIGRQIVKVVSGA